EMVVRRMGKSFLDHVIDPFILGVYAGDPHQLVPSYGLKKLYDLEQDFGSFIGGTIKKLIYNKRHGIRNPNRKIFSFKNGLDQLPKAIARKIGNDKFILGVENTQVFPQNDGSFIVEIIKNGEKSSFHSHKVVTACGSHALPKILPFIHNDDMLHIDNCLYTKVIEVQLGFNHYQGMKLDGFGGLCPFNQHHDILGILFMSATQTNRAPENGALLTVFLGGVRRQDIILKNDTEITQIVEREVTKLMRLPSFNPDLIKIIRHQHAIPQYGKESRIRFATISKVEEQFPGLTLGGNFIGGIGMSKRIVHAYEMAQKIINPQP
ncbi:MAG: protoporphyrinogen oxidase, partial [Lentisphaeria bacterium]